MHENAMRELDQTTVEVQTLQSQQTISQSEPDQSFLERMASGLENVMSSSRQSLDVEARLNELKDRVESSVEEIIRLIVVFTLQTILIPLGTAYLCLWLMPWAWRQRSGPPASDCLHAEAERDLLRPPQTCRIPRLLNFR